jgi:hypothetical protein
MSRRCRSKHTQADLDRDGVDFATVDGFQVRLGFGVSVIAEIPLDLQSHLGVLSTGTRVHTPCIRYRVGRRTS